MPRAIIPAMAAPLGNIGPTGQHQRRLLGFIAAAIGVALLVALDRAGLPPLWRLALFPCWGVSALGFLQARAHTCVVLAAQGTCDRELGRQLTDSEATALKRQARGILVRVVLTASALTLLTLAIPA